ncbi:MAG: hypothetical protein KAV00_08940, partial [Phycisphaerae bacterium]|nr:hypothetical protein [Phycisphaerae bacterium]
SPSGVADICSAGNEKPEDSRFNFLMRLKKPVINDIMIGLERLVVGQKGCKARYTTLFKGGKK